MLRTKVVMSVISSVGLLFVLTGCGGSGSSSSGSVTLNVEIGQGASDSAAVLKLFNEVKRGFQKKYPHIQVKISTYNIANVSSVVNTMVASHRGPNVFTIGTTFVPTLSASHAFVGWTPTMLKEINFSNLVPSATRMDGVPGHQPVGVIYQTSPFALFYNKALFKKANITSPPTTWAQFVADAKKMTHPSQRVWGSVIAPADPNYSLWMMWALARQVGQQLVNSQGTKANFASPKVVSQVRFYLNMLRTYHIVSPADVQYNQKDAFVAFMQGKAAMMPFGGMFDIPVLRTNPTFMRKDVGVAPVPTLPVGYKKLPQGGVPAESFVSGQEMTIFKYGTTQAQQAAAVKWIGYFDSPSVQTKMWKSVGYLPVNRESLKNPALKAPLWHSFEQILPHEYPTRRVAGWLAINTVFDKSLAGVFDSVALHNYHSGQLISTLRAANQKTDSVLSQFKAP